MDNELKKLIALGAAGSLAIAGAFTLVHYAKVSEEEQQYYKPSKQIVMDAQSFGADMHIAELFSNQLMSLHYVRLAIHEDDPVQVQCVDLNEREIEAVNRAINYYNNVFETINEHYKFKLVDEYSRSDSAKIEVCNYSTNMDRAYGEFWPANKTLDAGEGRFIKRGSVRLDWDQLKDKDDAYLYYVIIHELGHALGLGDIYTNEKVRNTNIEDVNSIMFVANSYKDMNKLFPNDYAILQALYSNEYKKHDNYNDAVKVVNEKIDKYTHAFYDYLADTLKSNSDVCDIDESAVSNVNITWDRIKMGGKRNYYELEINEDKCIFTIKDSEGNILEKDEPELIYQNGILFVKNIFVYDVNNFADYSHQVQARFGLYVYTNSLGRIMVGDTLIDGRYFAKVNSHGKEEVRR